MRTWIALLPLLLLAACATTRPQDLATETSVPGAPERVANAAASYLRYLGFQTHRENGRLLAYAPAVPGQTKAAWLDCGMELSRYGGVIRGAAHQRVAPVVVLNTRRTAEEEQSAVSIIVGATWQRSYAPAPTAQPAAMTPKEAARLRNRLLPDCYSRGTLEEDLLAVIPLFARTPRR